MLDWLRNRMKGRAPAGPGVQELYDSSQFEDAAKVVESRLDEDPNDAEALYVQGLLQLDAGQAHQAMLTLRRAAQAQPRHVEAWIALARASVRAGSKPGADEAFAKARALQPEHPRLLLELAQQALAARNFDEAHTLLARLRGPEPGSADAFVQLAAHHAQGRRFDIAQRLLRRGLESDPDHAQAHADLGAALRDLGRPDEAIEQLQRALELKPGLAQASFQLAMLRVAQQDWAQAVPLLERAAASDPRDAETHYWLGHAQLGWGDAENARQAYRAAVRLKPDHLLARWGETMAQLPAVARDATDLDESLLHFRQELDRLRAWCANNRVAEGWHAVGVQQPSLLAAIEKDTGDLLRVHGQLCAALMDPWAKQQRLPLPEARAPGSKLRVGIVSPHVHAHPVWDAVLRGWLAHLDPARFELHLFHTGSVRDAQTQWAEGRVASLRHGLGDWPAWVDAIVATRCDALLYPAIGLDATTLRLACLRLARVQLAGRGHPITTGLPTIDAFVSADALEPPGGAAHYSERLIALPRLGCAVLPATVEPQAPDLAAWGVAPGDRLLLCAGAPSQYGPRDDALWVELARRCRPCKLLFFARPGDLRPRMLDRRLQDAFGAAGVDFAASVRFVPWQPRAAFLGLMQRAELLLDPIGSSSFTTAIDAVLCATPIVAWDGQFLRGRLAAGVLRELGLEACVATTLEEYAGIAEGLCTHASARETVRKRMREARDRLFDDRRAIEALGAELEALASAR